MIGPICACLGCHEHAETEIVHDERGRMVVCEAHAEGYQEVLA